MKLTFVFVKLCALTMKTSHFVQADYYTQQPCAVIELKNCGFLAENECSIKRQYSSENYNPQYQYGQLDKTKQVNTPVFIK